MSANTLLLTGKPGTGKIPPGKVAPLNPVKAKPELTQNLVLMRDVDSFLGESEWADLKDFPFPKGFCHIEYRNGIKVGKIEYIMQKANQASPSGEWGFVQAQNGEPDPPEFFAEIVKNDGVWKLVNFSWSLILTMGLTDFTSEAWVLNWDGDCDRLIGITNSNQLQRKYHTFSHEMDHFKSWMHYWSFMLKNIFRAINFEFASEKDAAKIVEDLNFNSREGFLSACARSHAFDTGRGAPLTGGKYQSFHFLNFEKCIWREQNDPLPTTKVEFAERIAEVKSWGDS